MAYSRTSREASGAEAGAMRAGGNGEMRSERVHTLVTGHG